jgi:Domain of unknown function (DUF4124)
MRLRERSMLGAALLLLAANANASTEIFRCTAPDGSVTYQQVPCPTAASGGAVDIPSSFPEANALERERLFQREAALDARLLKRAEIDAAERIAREDRLAREREAQAERDRVQNAQNAPAYVVVARSLRMQRHPPRRPWPIAIR